MFVEHMFVCSDQYFTVIILWVSNRCIAIILLLYVVCLCNMFAILKIIIKLHCCALHKMHPVVTSVAWPVSLHVGHICELWLSQLGCCLGCGLRWVQRPCDSYGPRSPTASEESFWEDLYTTPIMSTSEDEQFLPVCCGRTCRCGVCVCNSSPW